MKEIQGFFSSELLCSSYRRGSKIASTTFKSASPESIDNFIETLLKALLYKGDSDWSNPYFEMSFSWTKGRVLSIKDPSFFSWWIDWLIVVHYTILILFIKRHHKVKVLDFKFRPMLNTHDKVSIRNFCLIHLLWFVGICFKRHLTNTHYIPSCCIMFGLPLSTQAWYDWIQIHNLLHAGQKL